MTHFEDLLKISIASQKLSDALRPLLNEIGKDKSVYRHKDRLKSTSGIVSKIQRLNEEDNNNVAVSDLDDIWGFRFVVYFANQVPKIVREILISFEQLSAKQMRIPFIHAIYLKNLKIFLPDGFDVGRKMSTIFTEMENIASNHNTDFITRSFADLLSLLRKNIKDDEYIIKYTEKQIQNAKIHKSDDFDGIIGDQSCLMFRKKDGYSSIHMVFQVKIEIEFPDFSNPSLGRNSIVDVCFEIQIRDIIEEAWSEVDHILNYSFKDRSDTKNDLHMVNRLREYKNNLNNGRVHLDVIRKNLVRQKYLLDNLLETHKSQVISDTMSISNLINVKEKILEQMNIHNISESSKFGEIYAAVSSISSANWGEDSKKIFSMIISGFTSFQQSWPENFRKIIINQKMKRDIDYYLKIEIANAKYFRSVDGDLDDALYVYDELYFNNREDPIASYRFARAMIAKIGRQTLAVIGDSSKNQAFGHTGLRVSLTHDSILDVLGDFESKLKVDIETGADHWLALAAVLFVGFVQFQKIKPIIEKLINLKYMVDDEFGSDLFKIIEGSRFAILSSLSTISKFRNISLRDSSIENYDGIYVLLLHKSVSNAIYYAAKFVRLEISAPKPRDVDEQWHKAIEDCKSKIEQNIEFLKSIKIKEYSDMYRSDHNVMLGYLALGNTEMALEEARRIRRAILRVAERRSGMRDMGYKSAQTYLSENERECLWDATDVITNDGVDMRPSR